ncbi:hypothetical protein GCM10009739_32200 [Microbacterium ulmi]|nr:LysM peptidoglycan-binding domain-containing protein [Microbacterium ulmi]
MLVATPAQAAEPSRTAAGARQAPAFTGPAAVLNVRVAANTPPATYVVGKGDSVWAIATRFGLRTSDVLALNGLAASSIIRPGQVLRLTGAPAAPAPAPEPSGGDYTVQKGDTISGIASRHGVSTQAVLSANGLVWSSIIYPGQRLTIPGSSAPTAPAPAPVAPSTPPPAAAGGYVVQKGDTIYAIAKRSGLSTAAVLDANGLTSASIIYPGQRIVIPGASAPAPAAPTAPAPPAPAPPSASGAYTVKGGDTISGIAKSHGVTTQAVLGANGLGWSSVIYPGQRISIPGAAAPAATAPAAPAPPAPVVQLSATLDAEQTANAQLIIRIGRELGVPERGIAIALGSAMQESSLRNLDHGDRDSLGLFQQRPSTGWGTADEVRDPVRATKAFYGGPSDPNGSRTRGLLDIAGWEAMTFTQAAQAVQISAYPDYYAKWEQASYTWLAALG